MIFFEKNGFGNGRGRDGAGTRHCMEGGKET